MHETRDVKLSTICFSSDDRKLSWEQAMQTIAGISAVTMVSGLMYRSVSLYHPRRNVIMHIKNQKKCRRERDQVKKTHLLND